MDNLERYTMLGNIKYEKYKFKRFKEYFTRYCRVLW